MTASKSVFDLKRPGRRVVLAWTAMTLVATFISLGLGERMRRGVFDSWQAINPRDLSGSDVRVVMIDNPSIGMVGSWPWPRYYLARLTEELAARKARVIAFDVLFPEHDRIQPDTFVSFYPELSPGAAEEVKALEPMDQLFGKVVGSAPVILAHAGVDSAPADQAPLVAVPIEGKLPPDVDSWPMELAAIPELDDVALGSGLVNGRPDSDGVVRGVPMVVQAGGQPRPGFALEIARNVLGAESIAVASSRVRLGSRAVPIDRKGRMRLHFGTFPAEKIISAAEVLGHSKHLQADAFDGKTVIIGISAEGSSDIAATPLAAEEYGPLVQAQAVDTILRGGWLERPAWAGPAEWAAAVLLALLALASAIYGRKYRYALAALFLSLPFASWLAFSRAALLIDPARPMLVGLGAVAGVAMGMFALARIERERLRVSLFLERVVAAENEGELQAARAIQLAMVPPRSRLGELDRRVDIDALLEPAKSVGGDFYDVMKIADDRVGFAIADVTGKGVPAALFMAMSKALTSAALSRMVADPLAMASAINTELLKDNSEAMSVTMILGIIELATGEVRMVCAGHDDPLLVSAEGLVSRVRLEGGPPFCIQEYDYPLETLTLRPGEALVLVTDGVTEAQDSKGALFGSGRVLSGFEPKSGTAAEICEAIRGQVRSFEDGTEATDDLTVMALRYR